MEKITKECYKKLMEEANEIKKKILPSIRAKIQDARRHGDFSENAELQSELKHKQLVEKRLLTIEQVVFNSEVVEIDKLIDQTTIQFGASVTVMINDEKENIKTYIIVGLFETDIKMNKICYKSPFAQLLIGKKVKDSISLNNRSYKIIKIEYANILN